MAKSVCCFFPRGQRVSKSFHDSFPEEGTLLCGPCFCIHTEPDRRSRYLQAGPRTLVLRNAWTSTVPKRMAQYARIREYRQYRAHYFGAILPILSVLGSWAIMLGILEVQVVPFLPEL